MAPTPRTNHRGPLELASWENRGDGGVPPPVGVTWEISVAPIGGRQIHKGGAPATEITQFQDGKLYTS